MKREPIEQGLPHQATPLDATESETSKAKAVNTEWPRTWPQWLAFDAFAAVHRRRRLRPPARLLEAWDEVARQGDETQDETRDKTRTRRT